MTGRRHSHDQSRRNTRPQHPLHRRAHLGLLGESGSGKSVTLRALMRLLPKRRTQISGTVQVPGRDVPALDDEEPSAFRGQTVAMIFQEPALALDPVYTIGRQIAQTVMRHAARTAARVRHVRHLRHPRYRRRD
jgi:peptide/nickel transport system ATP-binding protein